MTLFDIDADIKKTYRITTLSYNTIHQVPPTSKKWDVEYLVLTLALPTVKNMVFQFLFISQDWSTTTCQMSLLKDQEIIGSSTFTKNLSVYMGLHQKKTNVLCWSGHISTIWTLTKGQKLPLQNVNFIVSNTLQGTSISHLWKRLEKEHHR